MRRSTITKVIQRALYVTVWRFLPPCKEIVQTASASLDTDIGLHRRLILKFHLLTCRACTRYLTQIKFLKAAMQELEGSYSSPAAADLSHDVEQRLKDRLRSKSQDPL